MKKIIKVVTLMGVVISMMPSTAMAALTPVEISSSHNTDSDGVKSQNYSISTTKENKPWNYSYSYLKMRQGGVVGNFVNENAFTAKWRRPINDESGVSAWIGYNQSNIWKYVPFGAKYNGVVNYTDKVEVIYNHQSVSSVLAYKAHILGDQLSGSYQQELKKGLVLNTNVSYAKYSDENYRQTLGMTLKKDFGLYYRLGIAYKYDTSDINRSSVFYMPKGEHSLSITPEVAFPVGEGSVVMTASKSLSAKDINGKINSTTYGVGYHFSNMYIGTQYSHDDNYWSRDTSFSWNGRW